MPANNLFLPLLVLAALLLALGGWVAIAWVRSPYGPIQTSLYFINQLVTRILWRTEVHGRIDLPPDQGAVIICNHRASIDPWFIQLASPRMVHWMVAAEYFPVPVAGWLLRFMQAIPTRRGGVDTASTRAAIRYAAKGQLVGMLPEGRINDTPAVLLPVRSGAILVALKARVPVIPCYIAGAPYDGTVWGCFLMTAQVRLTVGRPIDLTSYYDLPQTPALQAELTLHVMREVARLGGHPDFVPTLAGRRWKPELADAAVA